MASNRRSKDWVLGGRHLVGVFVLLVVLFGMVFTLGYLLGRNQYDAQLRAAGKDARGSTERIVLVAPQQITEGENHTEQHDKQDKNSDELASSEYPILVASIA